MVRANCALKVIHSRLNRCGCGGCRDTNSTGLRREFRFEFDTLGTELDYCQWSLWRTDRFTWSGLGCALFVSSHRMRPRYPDHGKAPAAGRSCELERGDWASHRR